MAKKKKNGKKKVRVTREMVDKLSRLQGLEFAPDELGDLVGFPDVGDLLDTRTNIFIGCVDWLHYETPNASLLSVRIFRDFGILQEDALLEAEKGAAFRRSDGHLARNLDDYRAQFEQAANFGHSVHVETKLGLITTVVLFRCGCPCDEHHANAYPPEDPPDGGVGSL